MFPSLSPRLMLTVAVVGAALTLALLAFLLRKTARLQTWLAGGAFLAAWIAVMILPRDIGQGVMAVLFTALTAPLLVHAWRAQPKTWFWSAWCWIWTGAFAISAMAIAVLAFVRRDPDVLMMFVLPTVCLLMLDLENGLRERAERKAAEWAEIKRPWLSLSEPEPPRPPRA